MHDCPVRVHRYDCSNSRGVTIIINNVATGINKDRGLPDPTKLYRVSKNEVPQGLTYLLSSQSSIYEPSRIIPHKLRPSCTYSQCGFISNNYDTLSPPTVHSREILGTFAFLVQI